MKAIRRGARSSEFWFSVLSSATAVVACVAGAPIAGIAAAGIAVAYTVSRSVVKAKGGDIAGAAAEALKAAREAQALAQSIKDARK